jgi:glutamate:Na+ symporter, ESS family
VRKIELDLIFTLLVAMAVYFIGRALVARIPLLKRFSIPAPVVGGGLMAILLAVLTGVFGTTVSFNMSIKDSLLLMFFTTVGLGADVRMLAAGGRKLLLFLGISVVFIVIQNAIGLAASLAMDMHPVVGLLSGSITLTGGHGTGAAYAGRLGETMNLQGAMELTMACATAGLVIGAVMGGPLAEYLIKRHNLSGPAEHSVETASVAVSVNPGHNPGHAPVDEITVQSLIATLFWVLLCLAGGRVLVKAMEGSGFILPDFVFCLLLGVIIRNVGAFTGAIHMSAVSIDTVGSVALSLFLVMALMTMKLLDLVYLAGPLLVILGAQTIAMALYAIYVTFPLMGKNYDAAALSAGQVGFAMSSTACALAILKAVTERHGPSPLAFLVVPMVGAFFIDITNAMIIQAYLALPVFGF